jgi:hypothetical protein
MLNVTVTEDAITALNNSFKQDPSITLEERIIEFAVVQETGQDVYSHSLWNIYPEDLTSDTYHEVSLPSSAEFTAVIADKFIKYYDGIEVDYNIVYSELKDSEGEVFIFRRVDSE